MTEQEYVEGLAEVLADHDCYYFEALPDKALNAPSKASYRGFAQAITDWHREQGLRVVPDEPTQKMLEEGAQYHITAADSYRAMLDAAKGGGDE